MPVFRSGKKKSDEYYCKIFTMDAELQFTIEVNQLFYVQLFDRQSIFRQQRKEIQYFHWFVKQLGFENIGISV